MLIWIERSWIWDLADLYGSRDMAVILRGVCRPCGPLVAQVDLEERVRKVADYVDVIPQAGIVVKDALDVQDEQNEVNTADNDFCHLSFNLFSKIVKVITIIPFRPNKVFG